MPIHSEIETRSGDRCEQRRFGDVSPSEAAEAELTWFFNEAAIAMDERSNCCARLPGCGIDTLEEVERRAEARHAAGKIKDWLVRLRSTDALLLAGLYTERAWSDAVEAALPGGLAGAASALPRARLEHVRGGGPCVVPSEEDGQ
jgi:hypothetical protein